MFIAILALIWGVAVLVSPQFFLYAALVSFGLLIGASGVRMLLLTRKERKASDAGKADGKASSGLSGLSKLYPYRWKFSFLVALVSFGALVPAVNAWLWYVAVILAALDRSIHIVLQLIGMGKARRAFKKKSNFWAELLVSVIVLVVAAICVWGTDAGMVNEGIRWGLGLLLVVISVATFGLIIMAPRSSVLDDIEL